ncbi:MAG: IclR family transcriptional regulator [Pigmentiphaga sp.]|uniref:IclR family transcriptional regulator n=1 Tax=Pigmentiphaga sp. TaxID=1977564 RepID=UPI0029ABE73B|nr:IclR family transcriptional regulator [Pigmentiphaga sp.]MDX3906055.1 IclR family transcriptional regulator [Pigmentiphaga sp.]
MRGTSQSRANHRVQFAEPGADEDPGRQFVTALARGLNILQAFTQGDASLGNQELAERTGLTKPTVSRLTYTLTRLGYLVCSPQTGRYELGTSALALGYWAMAGSYIRQVAKPLMEQVSSELNLCCALGYRDDADAIYLEHTRGSGALIMSVQSGSRTPLVTTAMGRALIAVMDKRERDKLFAAEKTRYGAQWSKICKGVEEGLKDYQERGFTMSLGDWEKEIHAVGVPLALNDGNPPMALTLGGSAYTLDRNLLVGQIGPRLVDLAQQIRHSLKSRA